MSTIMTRTSSDIDKRLAQLRQEVPTRGLDRHISVLGAISELPAELQSPSLAALAAGESIQVIIYFPAQIQRGWNYTPRQALIFTASGAIHVLASIWPDEEPYISHIRQNGLMYMRISLLLLYGQIEIVAQGEKSPNQIGMEFNTVAWYRLSAPLHRILQATKDIPGVPGDPVHYSPIAQQAAEQLPVKFSNGVKIYGLLPGEKLEDLVFQPRIWMQKYILFRRPIITNMLLMLTSHFIAVIQEDLRVAQGWIVTHIPRNCISGMTHRPHELGRTLVIQMQRGGQSTELELLLSKEAVDDWRGVWTQHGGKWQDPDDADRPA